MSTQPSPEAIQRASSAAHELICIGEVLAALSHTDEVGGAVIEWLGQKVTEAAERAFNSLNTTRAPLPPEVTAA